LRQIAGRAEQGGKATAESDVQADILVQRIERKV
jgi:hypothetical protein